jgi:hypothetical protein
VGRALVERGYPGRVDYILKRKDDTVVGRTIPWWGGVNPGGVEDTLVGWRIP